MALRTHIHHLGVGRLHLVAILLATMLGAMAAFADDENNFVAGVEDLPLMPGLRQIEDAGTVFDSAGGRIVEAYAVGQVEQSAVENFYAESLPQLGWTIVEDSLFRRAGETLRLEFQREAEQLTVHFSLSPE